MEQDFAGKRALVVGANGGLGYDITQALLARGAAVAGTYRTPGERVEQLRAAGVSHLAQVDLVDAGACEQVVQRLVDEFGAPDVLVYAAGPHIPMRYLSQLLPEQIVDQLNQDVAAFFNLIRPVLPHLRATQASVVALSTAATDRYPVRDGLSSVPKAALEALIRGLAVEEGRFGIRFNAVGPGMNTDGMAARLMANGDLDARALEIAKGNIPLRRFGSAADITEAVCFLASDRAGYITGQKINVDGGFTA